jgi:hypothetical protein
MKKTITLLALLISFLSFAQVPQGISYQAIALNSAGNPVVSSNVRVRLSLLDNTATGTVLFSETHLKTTNAQGLFNLTIGQGTVVSGAFNTINWGINAKFLKVELDVTGGTSYVLAGTTQLLSVPYAMHAGTVTSIPASAVSGIGSDALKSSAFIVIDGSSVKGFNNGVWSSQAFSAQVYSSDVIETNKMFLIIDGSSIKSFANGAWATQTFSGQVYTSDIVESSANFLIIDNATVKGFSNGIWSTQTFSGQVYSSDIISSNGNFVVIDGSTVKGFTNGTWSTQTFSSQVYSSDIINSNGSFLLLDGSTIKSYSNGIWATQAFSGQVYSSDIITSAKN